MLDNSQYHELLCRGRGVARTYRLDKELAEDIKTYARKYNCSANDVVHWLLEVAMEQLKAGKIEPQIETVLTRLVR